jgi:hypothetical protein
MSKLFYDHLLVLEEVRLEIDNICHDKFEKEELWNIIDEILHHSVLDIILEKLNVDHHPEFLEKMLKEPYSENLLTYLKEKLEEDVELLISNEVEKVKKGILEHFNE